MGATQAEIHEQFARCAQHHARRLGRDQGLKVQDVDKQALNQLGDGQGRGHAQNRFMGEKHCAFRHGMNITGEAKRDEMVEQVLAEPAGLT